jgi:hypothetical protein
MTPTELLRLGVAAAVGGLVNNFMMQRTLGERLTRLEERVAMLLKQQED